MASLTLLHFIALVTRAFIFWEDQLEKSPQHLFCSKAGIS